MREFTDDPLGDHVVARIPDTASFALSGENAQAWHVVVIKDPGLRIRAEPLPLLLPLWWTRADPADGTHWTTGSSTHQTHSLAPAEASGRCW